MWREILTISIGAVLDGDSAVVAGLSSVSVRRGRFGGVDGACRWTLLGSCGIACCLPCEAKIEFTWNTLLREW